MEHIGQKIIKILCLLQKYMGTDMMYVAKNGFWLFGGKVMLFFISLLTMAAFATWFSKTSYGIYQYLIAWFALLGIFTLPGINISIIKSIAQGKEGTLQSALREKIKWGLVGSVCALALSFWYFFQGDIVLGIGFLIGAFFVPFRESFIIFADFLAGKKRFGMRAKYEVFSATLATLSIIPTIYYFRENILVVFMVVIASHTFFDVIFYKKTQQQITNNAQNPLAISFGKHLTVMSAVDMLAQHIDKIIIWKFLGPIPVAIYTFALLPVQKIQQILSLDLLILPKLSEKNIKERKKEISQKFFKLFLITTPLAAILILTGPFFYRLFLPQYIDSIAYFQALSFLITLTPFSLLSSSLIIDLRQRELYVIRLVTSIFKIVLFLTLTPIFGIWGLIAAILTSQILNGMLIWFFFQKI